MADQVALERKYGPVGKAVTDFAEYGSQMTGIYMNGEKLALSCNLPSKVVLNRVWDAIKAVDPSNQDFDLEATVAGDSQPYTIKQGDTLSAVCLKFYGMRTSTCRSLRQMAWMQTGFPWARRSDCLSFRDRFRLASVVGERRAMCALRFFT